ncbi:hypothetical protein GCM10010411_74810 [Actinomadura fulvescens]|uniref:HTH asnC-type domain-containing protein n=1 Tax=Actinomadura fulvescens TaxID=46160 RepID=A0ABP6CT27_9ACTN
MLNAMTLASMESNDGRDHIEATETAALDSVDLSLLAALADDGRATYQSLADHVGSLNA